MVMKTSDKKLKIDGTIEKPIINTNFRIIKLSIYDESNSIFKLDLLHYLVTNRPGSVFALWTQAQ